MECKCVVDVFFEKGKLDYSSFISVRVFPCVAATTIRDPGSVLRLSLSSSLSLRVLSGPLVVGEVQSIVECKCVVDVFVERDGWIIHPSSVSKSSRGYIDYRAPSSVSL